MLAGFPEAHTECEEADHQKHDDGNHGHEDGVGERAAQPLLGRLGSGRLAGGGLSGGHEALRDEDRREALALGPLVSPNLVEVALEDHVVAHAQVERRVLQHDDRGDGPRLVGRGLLDHARIHIRHVLLERQRGDLVLLVGEVHAAKGDRLAAIKRRRGQQGRVWERLGVGLQEVGLQTAHEVQEPVERLLVVVERVVLDVCQEGLALRQNLLERGGVEAREDGKLADFPLREEPPGRRLWRLGVGGVGLALRRGRRCGRGSGRCGRQVLLRDGGCRHGSEHGAEHQRQAEPICDGVSHGILRSPF